MEYRDFPRRPMTNETTVIDQLFLELSRFTKATTHREHLLWMMLDRIRKECGDAPISHYGTIGVYINRVLQDVDFDEPVPVAGKVS